MTEGWACAVPELRRALAAALGQRDWSWPEGLEERLFLDAVLRHRVVEVLADSDLVLPATVSSELTALRQRSRFRALALARELAQAVTLLDEAGIRVLVVKGMALAAQTTGDFTARGGNGDLDLFVSPDDVAAAHDVLAGAGWTIDRGFPAPGPSWAWRHLWATYCELPMTGGRSAIDLHWHLAPTRGVLPNFESAWSDRATVDVGGSPVATLGWQHALEHSCAHAMKDNWRWLRSLVDVRRLATKGSDGSYAERMTLGVIASLLEGRDARIPARYLRLAERSQASPPSRHDRGFPGTGVPRAIAESVRGNARPREVARVSYRFLVVPTADVAHSSPWVAIPATLGWRVRSYVRRVGDWRRYRRTRGEA